MKKEEEGLEKYRNSTRVEKETGVEKLANEGEVGKTADDVALTKPEDSSPVLNVTGVEERDKSHEAAQSLYDDDLQCLDTQLIFGEGQCIAADTEKRGEDLEEYIPHMEDKVEEHKGSIPVENDKGFEKSVTEMGANEEVAKELTNEDGIDKRPSEEVVNKLANEDEIKQLLYNEVVEKVANEDEVEELLSNEVVAKLANKDEVEELPSDEVVDKVANKEGIEKIEKSCAVPMMIGVEDLEKSDEVTQSMDDNDLEYLDTQLILENEFEQSIAAEKELGESTLIVKDKAGDHGESTQAETENGEEEQHESLAVLEDENEEHRESTPAVEEKGGDEFIESPTGVESKVEEEYKSTVAEKDNGCEEGDDSLAALTHKDVDYRESTPVEYEEQFGRLANEDEVEEVPPGEVVDKLDNEEEVEKIEDSISVLKETVKAEEPEKPSTVVELLQVVVDDVEKETKIDGLVTKLGVDGTQESTPIGNTKGEEEDVESVYQEEHVSTPAKP
ncbi:unnamed protein product [Orchesella dallaii]|uniref:Uncharacterized protein n=1 Tax=Orchesella dallaii TaxID=48710 RepID=A0ABP1RRR0_9HEXA